MRSTHTYEAHAWQIRAEIDKQKNRNVKHFQENSHMVLSINQHKNHFEDRFIYVSHQYLWHGYKILLKIKERHKTSLNHFIIHLACEKPETALSFSTLCDRILMIAGRSRSDYRDLFYYSLSATISIKFKLWLQHWHIGSFTVGVHGFDCVVVVAVVAVTADVGVHQVI